MSARRCVAVLTLCGCASAAPVVSGAGDQSILRPSSRQSHWPVEGESRPGLWIRLESYQAPVTAGALLRNLQVVVEHNGRRQLLTGPAFDTMPGAGDSHQTRYYYTPTSGVLFLTLRLATEQRWFFADTQRIELNDDCWNMISYRVTAMPVPGARHPPPYPRTIFLTPARSGDPPLYLEVFVSGNCFRNPLPPS